MSEIDGASLKAGLLFDQAGESLADARETNVPERILFLRAGHLSDFGKVAAFRNDDDAIVLTVVVVVLEQSADVVNIDLLLGDENDVGAACNSGRVGNPAGVAAHHFANDDAIVRVGGGVEAVDGFGGDHDRGVDTESLSGAGGGGGGGRGGAGGGGAGGGGGQS